MLFVRKYDEILHLTHEHDPRREKNVVRNLKIRPGPVFWVAVAISAAFVLWGVLFTGSFGSAMSAALDFTVSNFSWFFMLTASFFLVFVVWLAFSRYGKVKLGKEGDEPEFGKFSWFAMMFQAGMGPAIIFWGVAEPLAHYTNPPFGLAEPSTVEAAQLSIQYSFFHWAFHPWAIYAVVGLAVAYFNYRRDEPGLISPMFRPLIGDRVDGWPGKAIDILAVLAVLFGVAVALGQAGLQVTAGLGETFGTPTGIVMQLVVIGVTTLAFMASAATPLEYGIKWLANISMLVAPVLLIFYFVVGPTVTQLDVFTQGIGDYVSGIVPMSFRIDSFDLNTAWLSSWTVFYWSWWIAWAPYVGLFIARISRGRTIREFIAGAVLVPSLVTFVWFSVFGGAAIWVDENLNGSLAEVVSGNPAVGMFVFINAFPLPLLMSIVTLVLLWVFFVAGADAGTVVLGSMSSGGERNPKRWIRLTWGVIMAALAGILLVVGGLGALQTASILAGLPFAAIMVLMCFTFYKYLSSETRAETEGPPGDRDDEDGGEHAPAGRPASGGVSKEPAPRRSR